MRVTIRTICKAKILLSKHALFLRDIYLNPDRRLIQFTRAKEVKLRGRREISNHPIHHPVQTGNFPDYLDRDVAPNMNNGKQEARARRMQTKEIRRDN